MNSTNNTFETTSGTARRYDAANDSLIWLFKVQDTFDELLNHHIGSLNPKTANFIRDIYKQYQEHRKLSPKQQDILDDICKQNGIKSPFTINLSQSEIYSVVELFLKLDDIKESSHTSLSGLHARVYNFLNSAFLGNQGFVIKNNESGTEVVQATVHIKMVNKIADVARSLGDPSPFI